MERMPDWLLGFPAQIYCNRQVVSRALVEPLDHIVGTDASPVLSGEITVSQRFFNTIFHLFSASVSFIARSFAITALAFSLDAFLFSCA